MELDLEFPEKKKAFDLLDYSVFTMPRKRQRRSAAVAPMVAPPVPTLQKTANISPSKSVVGKKSNVDSMIKDLEKELMGAQTDVIDGFNKLERKIQCYRRPKSQLLVEQKNNCAERHIENLIIEMEMQQLAESVVQITGRMPIQAAESKKSGVKYASPIQESIYKNRPYLLMERIKQMKGSREVAKNGA